MPDLPRIYARSNIEFSGPLARTTPEQFGAGVFGNIAEIFKQITVDSEAAEARQAIAVTRERIKGAVQQSNDNLPDPDAFNTTANDNVKSVYSNSLSALSSNRARKLAEAGLAPVMVDAQNDVAHIFKQKQVLKGRAAINGTLEVQERELANSFRQEDIQAKETEIVNTMRMGTDSGFFGPDEGRARVQSIKERDSFRRGITALENTSDPLTTLSNLKKQLPFLDPDKTMQLLGVAQRRKADIDRETEKERERLKNMALLNDTMIAVSGAPQIPGQVDRNAREFGYTAADYRALTGAMEQGGITDPNEYTRLEVLIRTNQLTDYNQIAANRRLDRGAKSALMGLVEKQSDARTEKHFSKLPEYQEASKELRLAVSGKGQLESLSEGEQQRYLSGLKELWNRSEKGENPMSVSRELQTRIPKEPVQETKPAFFPSYQSEDELVNAFKSGKIDRQRFNTEAARLKQWQQYNRSQTQPQTAPEPGKSRR